HHPPHGGRVDTFDLQLGSGIAKLHRIFPLRTTTVWTRRVRWLLARPTGRLGERFVPRPSAAYVVKPDQFGVAVATGELSSPFDHIERTIPAEHHFDGSYECETGQEWVDF